MVKVVVKKVDVPVVVVEVPALALDAPDVLRHLGKIPSPVA